MKTRRSGLTEAGRQAHLNGEAGKEFVAAVKAEKLLAFPERVKTMSRGQTKALSLFLGVLMFMFGFLKFFQPFRGWFDIQIQQSHLPQEAILAGKLGEMVTGCLFLLAWLRRSLAAKSRDQVLLIACSILVAQMSVAIYVHLQPQVPASVLPLGIKAPVIPFVVLFLGLLTAIAVWKERRAANASDLLTR